MNGTRSVFLFLHLTPSLTCSQCPTMSIAAAPHILSFRPSVYGSRCRPSLASARVDTGARKIVETRHLGIALRVRMIVPVCGGVRVCVVGVRVGVYVCVCVCVYVCVRGCVVDLYAPMTLAISQDDAGGGIIMAAHVHRNVGPMFGFHFCPFEGVRVSACALVTHRGVVGGCGSTLVDGGRWKGAGPSMIAVVS
eukprot:GHVU01167260.1.p1 GENE.GHVU01167260.1~~GHVU01167260.1.p1  ORF type:complete len:194 (+),score=3.93 GHVU01167260.1:234-815(+)